MENRGWEKLIYDKDDKSFWLSDGLGVRMSINYPRLSRALGLAIKVRRVVRHRGMDHREVLDGNRVNPRSAN